jgi:hypothetical protein
LWVPNLVIYRALTSAEYGLQQDPTSPPPQPLSVMYFDIGKGGVGGGELNREKVRGATVHKAGSKIPTRRTVSPFYKL